MDFDWTEEDRLGMSLQPGSVSIEKDSQNLLGISIGGGAPLCPCLYIVQVFDNTPAAKSGVLEAGDELMAVNSTSVKGKTKVEVARMIQNVRNEVTIGYNKLSCEASQGKSFDIVLKKMKHKMVENMSSSTADALGLSRAILCNDGLIKKMQEMEKIAAIYRGMMNNTRGLLWGYLRMAQAHRLMGEVFSQVGAKEPQFSASEGFRKYGEAHRSMEKFGVKLVRTVKPMVSDLDTYLNKAIPDTKHTIRKYADVKFEYLSFCLKA
ncbi:PRKCA-binding protein-like [Symsagittifera roscoffensis]|uniref:PRKCA-binding protein-like n=1 Tax=Symsagittifera roscoffensis TaxID=84072 RepID=UPI00307C0C0F